MALLKSARYQFGAAMARFLPHNPDNTIGGVAMNGNEIRVVGGVGPFDVSGASDSSAIPMTIKFDNGAEETKTVDLSGASSASAVTVDEVVAAITTTAFTNLSCTKEANTGRPLLKPTAAGSIKYMQVYGELAELIDIGYGLTMKFIKTDTLKSSDETVERKEDEKITNTDSNGKDVEISTDGYRKGLNLTLTDTAADYALRALIEGGDVDTDGNYTPPTVASDRRYFYFEIFNPIYSTGTHKEADMIGYTQQIVPHCKGTFGDRSKSRGWVDWIYAIEGTTYTDAGGTFRPDSLEVALNESQFEALHFDTV